MHVPDELIEAMVQAAVTDAFHQKGLSREKQVQFDAEGQNYSFMGIDLKQCMAAAVATLEENGWTISALALDDVVPSGVLKNSLALADEG